MNEQEIKSTLKQIVTEHVYKLETLRADLTTATNPFVLDLKANIAARIIRTRNVLDAIDRIKFEEP
jgi:hypothetical protein